MIEETGFIIEFKIIFYMRHYFVKRTKMLSATFIFVISAIQICSSQIHMVDIENTTIEFPNIFFSKNETPTPIVLWHGMGDNCCHEFRYDFSTCVCTYLFLLTL